MAIFNSSRAYGSVAVVLHWAIALLIGAQLALGLVMTRLLDAAPVTQFWAYQWHKSFGLTTLALCLIRLGWWLANRHPAPVDRLGPMPRRAARIVQFVLLVLPLAVAGAGWAVASSSVLDIPTVAFNLFLVPDLPLERSEVAEAGWTRLHRLGAYALGFFAAGHAFAALWHHLWLNDATLRRMLRPGREAPLRDKRRNRGR